MYENIFAGFAIDTNDPALADSFAPIPEGYYPAVVESIEQGVDKAGGVRFTAKARLRDCPFAGRVVSEFYNIGSTNPQAVEIGRKQLAALARACGVNGQLTSPQQVINIPVYVKISAPKPEDKFPRVGTWLSVEAGQRLAAGNRTAKPAAAAPAFVPPTAPAAPTFAAPAQPQPVAQPVVQPAAFPAQAVPQAAPAAFPAQPAAQPAAAPTHKMPWEQ